MQVGTAKEPVPRAEQNARAHGAPPIKLTNLRMPAMSDDAADYGGSSDADLVRVIRSPPLASSQLERNRAFGRMILASFMLDSYASVHHHRRNGRRSASEVR